MDKNWRENALKLLEKSLKPVPSELNSLDWKSGLSDKTDRLAQHLSAFSNLSGGGILVYGINNDGEPQSMSKEEIEATVQKLSNIAKNNLSFSITIEHAVMDYEGHPLLFIYVPEQHNKPVALRGNDIFNAYIRSGNQTVKMSGQQVREYIALSNGFQYEERIAKRDLSKQEVLELLDYRKFYELRDKNIPTSEDTVLAALEQFNYVKKTSDGLWNITNLGAILFAKHITDFSFIAGKTILVRKYQSTNNRQMQYEYVIDKGYAAGFEELLDHIMRNTSTERIDGLREAVPTYPRVAVREFVANALVHQDFAITGMPITVEIFSNRLIITNPGASLNDINRLIDLPPQSRNEMLAQSLLLLGICERRGSGVDRAIEAIEGMHLPAAKFSAGESHTRVTLYPEKLISDMTKQEKIDACYQHACLMYEDDLSINNQSMRDRFHLDKNKSAVVSRIISDTLEAGKIKLADDNIASRKYATYIPFYG